MNQQSKDFYLQIEDKCGNRNSLNKAISDCVCFFESKQYARAKFVGFKAELKELDSLQRDDLASQSEMLQMLNNLVTRLLQTLIKELERYE